MEYEACRILELVNHARRGDAEAQSLLIEELRAYLGGLVERYGALRNEAPDFAQQVLSRARRDYSWLWDRDSEFGA